MDTLDKERWKRLSPQLDELLELTASGREQRIASIRAEDPEQAACLETLIARLAVLDRDAFLETPALRLAQGLAGQSVGPYVLDSEIGRGGMGSVWLARRADGRYEGRVAVKFLHLGLIPHGGGQRFAREGHILGRLAHPNIARLIDAGVAHRQQPYLVLEYIDGEPIDRHCERLALAMRARLHLFLDVLAAVSHAHNRLILHRDLKPRNIMVTAGGEVKLLDFGIAKLIDDAHEPMQVSELTQIAGRPFTLAYAAPEQVQDGEVTTATDVYSLGVLLYVLLSGKHPTLPPGDTATPLQQLRAVIERQPPRLSDAARDRVPSGSAGANPIRELRGDLDSIVAKALQKSPAARYANAAAFAEDLRRYLADMPIGARPDTRTYRALKFVQRHRLGVAAAATVALTLAGGASAVLLQAREVRVQQSKAEDLIEFMLGELRNKLEPVGRLEVLDSVGEKALAYYEGQATRLLDADALGRRSRALHLIGEIAELRGDLDAASTVFQRAAASTARLVQRSPNHGQHIFDHSQSVYWVGYVAWRRGLLPQARAAFGEYLQLARQLVQLDATNVDWRVEEGHAHQNLGVVLYDAGDAAGALTEFLQARTRFSSLIEQRPALLGTLISSRGWVAKAKENLGDIRGAIAEIEAQLALRQRGSNAAGDRSVQEAVAIAESELSRLELCRGDAATATRYAQDAVQRLAALRLADPENTLWAQELAWAHVKSADARMARRDSMTARADLDAAQAIVDALLAKDATVTKRQINLLGRVLLSKAQLAALTASRPPVVALEKWLESISSSSLEARQKEVVAAVHLLLGDAYSQAGDLSAGQRQWQRGAQLLVLESGAGAHPMSLTVLAQLQIRQRQHAAAAMLARRIAATDFRHPTYADLTLRIARTLAAAH